MEKVIWVQSNKKDGLDVVNAYLKEGWKVKLISASSGGGINSSAASFAYIVIEWKE